jgi:NitT/TauT family transport system substrate-binding protein
MSKGYTRLWRRLGLAVVLLVSDWGLAHAADIRIGVTNASSDAALFIADKRGYFRQEGLAVTLMAFDAGAKMIPLLGNGQLEVGAGAASPGLYNAVERGLDLKIVADKARNTPGYGYQSLLVRKDLIDSGEFKGLADLKGRKVAVVAQASSDNSVLNEAMKSVNLRFEDVEKVYMGFSQHAMALRNRAIDASITTEPTTTFIVKAAIAARFVGSDSFYPNQQTAVIIYAGDFIKNRPAEAFKFMRAYLRAVRDYNTALKDGKLAGKGAEEIISILTEYASLKDPEVYRAMTPHGCNPDGKVNIESLQKDWLFFKDKGDISGKLTVDQVVDMRFVDSVLNEIGPYSPPAN